MDLECLATTSVFDILTGFDTDDEGVLRNVWFPFWTLYHNSFPIWDKQAYCCVDQIVCFITSERSLLSSLSELKNDAYKVTSFRLLTPFFIHLKCQQTGTSAKATNLIERWMIRCEGTWSNDQCPRLVRLALFEVTKFRDSFSFPEEHHVKSSNWERSSWASCLGFLDLSKNRRARFWI